MVDKCIVCGNEVPEGRQVCSNCEIEYDPNGFFSAERRLDNPTTLMEAIRIIRTINPSYERTRSGKAEEMILMAIHNGATLIVHKDVVYPPEKLEAGGFEL